MLDKLVIITDQPPWTGIGRYARELHNLMHKHGVSSRLIYNGYTPIGQFYNKDDFEVPDFVKMSNSYYIVPVYRKMNAKNLNKMKGEIGDHIIHFCGSDYSSVSMFNNSVATVHDLRFDVYIKSMKNFFDSLYRDAINIKTVHDIKF
ncbi:MAG: hypothetical protein QXP36_09800, partial [Conexivisphaerales archaeon]